MITVSRETRASVIDQLFRHPTPIEYVRSMVKQVDEENKDVNTDMLEMAAMVAELVGQEFGVDFDKNNKDDLDRMAYIAMMVATPAYYFYSVFKNSIETKELKDMFGSEA